MKLFNACVWLYADPMESIVVTCDLRFTELRKHVGSCQLSELGGPFALGVTE